MTDSELPRIVGRTRHGELTIDQIAELQPGLGRLMPEISDAYAYAHHAAKGGNWGLARYYVKKTASLFKLCAVARPKHKERLERYAKAILEPLDAEVAKKDFAAFDAKYQEGIELANRD